jgi:hypothetical protein
VLHHHLASTLVTPPLPTIFIGKYIFGCEYLKCRHVCMYVCMVLGWWEAWHFAHNNNL